MNVVSICSGVGLLDLGLEWAGIRTIQFCEIAPFCQGILAQRFPGVPIHSDAWTLQPEPCDVIAAGFPCQPFSLAGKGLGANDPRHLWPAVIRSIRPARPRYIILENVPGLLARGLGDVLGDMAGAGYDAEWTVFGAFQVGALHPRKRVWIVATSDPNRSRVWDEQGGFFRPDWGSEALAWHDGTPRTVAHTDSRGQQVGCERDSDARRVEGRPRQAPLWDDTDRRGADMANPDSKQANRSPVAWRQSHPWAVEPDVGRVAYGVPARVDRLRALGNGVVPQCAELVGRRLMQLDATRTGGPGAGGDDGRRP